MAMLEIEAAAEEQARAQWKSCLAGLSLATFTTDDGEVYEIPDLPADLSRASEAALAKF